MSKGKAVSSLAIVSLCALAALAAIDVHATQRTFVASNGDDTHPCTLASPCRGFAAAITAVDPGGEVVVLNSAGYGGVVIDKSVSIVAPPGVYAGISVASGDGISVEGSGIDVALKGLAINGQGGANGIVFTAGASLVVERCDIANFTGDGIRIMAPGFIVVSQTTSSGNMFGLSVLPGATGANVAISGSRFDANSLIGLYLAGAANIAIDHTTIAGNASEGISIGLNYADTVRVAIDSSTVVGPQAGSPSATGISVGSAPSSFAYVDITRTVVARNQYGVGAGADGTTVVTLTDCDIVDNAQFGVLVSTALAGPTSIVRANRNRVMRNGTGFRQLGTGVLYTPGTNYVRDNGTDDGGHTADSLL